jgi:tryptophan synthase alpha chain
MSRRYQTLFSRLSAAQEGAFVPFVTLGDPDPETSLRIIQTLIDAGADALELGMPFSDPLADGPVIQEANTRALRADVTPRTCLMMIRAIRERNPAIPIGLLLYANLVFAFGIDAFYEAIAAAGADSALVADIPIDESQDYIAAAKRHGISPVMILPPNADAAVLQAIARLSEGYLYLMSRAGVTGTESAAGMPVEHVIKALDHLDSAPALLGFGISNPEQVRAAMSLGVAGVIVGSAIVDLIAKATSEEALHERLRQFALSIKAATISPASVSA